MAGMRLLVLGGTHHVGRCVVEAAAARGDHVTTVNRGRSGVDCRGVEVVVHADRTIPGELARELSNAGEWDAVIDTWSWAPSVVEESARLLVDRVGHYGYVSSRSVYSWPIALGADESAPVVDADPASSDATDYAAAKRGGELAVERAFGSRSLLARAGLILGPYEIVGRLPWWLGRLARGGRTLAPGPFDRPLQYVDGRDLAEWMLSGADHGLSGAFNAVSPPGATTMGELLDIGVRVTGGVAELVWADSAVILAAGIAPWTELPIWLPPTGDLAGLHAGNVDAARAAGLTIRPIEQTVADTWAWLQREGFPAGREDRPSHGISPEVEERVLAQLP